MSEEDLDELERAAVAAYHRTYGSPTTDAERLFVQRGIDAMRFAVAKAQDGVV